MRVVVADDAVLLREGVVRLLTENGHAVVAAVGDGPSLVQAILEHRPEVSIVDVRMPPSHTDEGARAAAELKHAHPELGVLVLSQHVETRHAVELVSLGGFGYLLKDRVLQVAEFLAAAERVAGGGSALDPKVVASLITRNNDDPLEELTMREREVLELMAEGLTNAGIAKRLCLSERTIEAHVRHVLMKLSVPETDDSNRRVLAVLAHLTAARQTE